MNDSSLMLRGKVLEFFKSNDPMVKYIEAGWFYIDDIASSDLTLPRLTMATMRLARMCTDKSLISQMICSEKFLSLLDTLSDIANEPEDVHLQSFEQNLSAARNYLDQYELFTNSRLFKQIYKICMYVLSFSILDQYGINFNSAGYSKFESELIKKKFYKRTDFVHVLLDSCLHLIEKGFFIIKTGRVDCILHSKAAYSEWFDTSAKLQRQSNLLSNPEAHGFNELEFRAELDEAIDKGDAIVRVAMDMEHSEKRVARKVLNDLIMVKHDITTKQAAREDRKPPFSILICGDSGVGKTSLKAFMYHRFNQIMGYPEDPKMKMCYTRNPVEEFWSGFTTSVRCVVMDDIAFMHPNAAPSGDPSCMEVLQVINGTPFVPAQASLEDKGRTPMKAELCIATTNTIDLNAHRYFSHPSAVQRRFPYIVIPTVKDEYKDDRGMLDSSKTQIVEGETPNWWHWTIMKVSPVPIGGRERKARIEVDFTTSDADEFYAWFARTLKDFRENQDKVVASMDMVSQMRVCGICFMPEKKCGCHLQSGEVGFVFGVAFTWICAVYFQNCLLFLYSVTGFEGLNNLILSVDAFISLHWAKKHAARMKDKIVSIAEDVTAATIPKKLLLTGAAVTAFCALYKLYSCLSRPKLQSKSAEIGTAPKANEKERDNVWYKNDFQLSHFDLTPRSTSSKAMDEDQVLKAIENNVVHLDVFTDLLHGVPCVAVCLQGHQYLTNNHCITKGCIDRVIVTYQSGKDGVTKNITLMLDETQVVRYPQQDVCVITMRALPMKRGIYDLLPRNSIDLKHNGFLLYRGEKGELIRVPTKALRNYTALPRDLPEYNGKMYRGLVGLPTDVGYCGSPLVVKTDIGYVIAGLHFMGDDNHVISVSTGIDSSIFPKADFAGVSKPMLSSQSVERKLGALHPKSTFRYLEEGTAEVYGSFIGFRPKPKSTVEITPMSYHLSKEGYKINYGAPVMKGWVPWRIAAQDMVKPVVNFQNAIVEECKNSYMKDIMMALPPEMLNMLEVYDNFTALNGARGTAYVDKMNWNASAGFPFKKGKKFFIKRLPPQNGLDHPVEAIPEIMDRVDTIISRYHDGERAYPVFTGHLKDEAVSFKKIKLGKTRVFTGSPFDWTIVVRKYLLSTIRLIQNNRYAFEAAPGTVAQSYEWHEMYNYITKYGKHRVVAGDYKAFDKRMSPVFILAAFDILHDLCELSGNYSDEDLRAIRGIAEDTAFPLVDFNGDLVQFYGSNPSGHPLTVIINSLVNSLYMRYAYRILNPRCEVSSFRSNVSLMTYGDDNIMSVSENAPWYNHTSVALAFKTMGIVYTMPDKEAESVPYIDISQASFLKRSWRMDADIGAFLAPLDHDSIEKMLMVWTRSKQISQEEQALAVITTAAREYFYYGHEVYSQKLSLLSDLLVKLDICDWILPDTFLTFEQLRKQFWDNSQRIGCLPDAEEIQSEFRVLNWDDINECRLSEGLHLQSREVLYFNDNNANGMTATRPDHMHLQSRVMCLYPELPKFRKLFQQVFFIRGNVYVLWLHLLNHNSGGLYSWFSPFEIMHYILIEIVFYYVSEVLACVYAYAARQYPNHEFDPNTWMFIKDTTKILINLRQEEHLKYILFVLVTNLLWMKLILFLSTEFVGFLMYFFIFYRYGVRRIH